MCFFVVVVFIVCKKGGKKNFFFLHVNLFPFFVFHDVSDFVNERRVRYRKWEKKNVLPTTRFLLLFWRVRPRNNLI